ncbi:hypothetical protein CR513_58062, partial [Mucuna pruriens]
MILLEDRIVDSDSSKSKSSSISDSDTSCDYSPDEEGDLLMRSKSSQLRPEASRPDEADYVMSTPLMSTPIHPDPSRHQRPTPL